MLRPRVVTADCCNEGSVHCGSISGIADSNPAKALVFMQICSSPWLLLQSLAHRNKHIPGCVALAVVKQGQAKTR